MAKAKRTSITFTDSVKNMTLDKHRLPDGRSKLTAHDVRQLRQCGICELLGDDRTMIHPVGPTFSLYRQEDRWHPKCFLDHFGGNKVWGLPQSERRKFTLGDAGQELMMELVEWDDMS